MVSKELRARTVQVYLPSEDVKAEWEALADDQGMSLSRWVQAVVQSHRARRQRGESGSKVSQLQEELDDAQDRIADLEQRLEEKNALIEKFEDDLQTYRAQAFRDPDFAGTRTFPTKLVGFLSAHRDEDGDPKVATQRQILRAMEISEDDPEGIRTVSEELRHLKNAELVEATARGWRWTA